MKVRLLGLVIGALIGAFLGTGTGVVIGGGGGLRGLWVFSALFGIISLFAAPDVVRLWGWLKGMWK